MRTGDKEIKPEKPDATLPEVIEETTLVTGVEIEPVINGWIVTVVYDEDEYRKFTFTNLSAMLDFVKDMTGTPIRVCDSK